MEFKNHHNSVSDKILHGAWPGPKAYLTFKKEEELASFFGALPILVFFILWHKFWISKVLVRFALMDYGRDFVTSTKKYHYKNAVTLAVIRAKATDRESFMMYFEILEDTLIKNECTYITVTKLVFL